uniref:Uncharacterized protein n=1 Tax=Parascaris equorum TaxID=6256 RepID=A0A914R414_PAREQ
MRISLRELYAQKNELVEKYNKEREDYTSWMKKKKANADDELEPFFEQKRDCRRLIAYLESLESQMEPVDRTPDGGSIFSPTTEAHSLHSFED